MQIFDAHTHLFSQGADGKSILANMAKAGVCGGCVFSDWPKEANAKVGKDFEARMSGVLSATKGCDKLYPVMWIHPFEEDIINKVHTAAERGIVAFKIICTDFYVYDERCLTLLREIASLGKPVFFHTGILWDGQVSSSYNRPINWESLLDIKGLRFSMAHVSWPWHDECIAVYGEFLNAQVTGETAEMFIDMTPGTPDIYREEVLTKLFRIGYDFEDNLMFGTDCTAESYSFEWAKKWIDKDNSIMDKLGVCERVREKMYGGNLERFLFGDKDEIKKSLPESDDSHMWDPTK